MSFSLSISLSACLRFLSVDVCACERLSHVLNLSIDFFIDVDSGFPVASLLTAPITVDSPMSCIVIDVPAPTLLLSTPSFAKDLHSGPSAAPFSVTTIPQVLHANSPEFSSKTSVALLHDGQR